MKRVFGWHFSVTLYELGCLRKVQVSIAYDHAPCHVTSRHVADIWFGYCWQVRPVVSHLLNASLLFSTLRQNFQVTSVLEFFLYFCHTFFPFRFGKNWQGHTYVQYIIIFYKPFEEWNNNDNVLTKSSIVFIWYVKIYWRTQNLSTLHILFNIFYILHLIT